MTYVFSESEKAAAIREKKRLLTIWIVALVVYVALAATLVTVDLYLVEVHRIRTHTGWMGVLFALASCAFGGFTLFFFAVKYKLTRKFVRMLRDMERGLKDEFEAKFVAYDDQPSMKDGVFFYSMILKTKPLRRDDIDERKLLIEHTVPKPELTEGTKLRLISHANILVAYEILYLAPPPEKPSADESEAKIGEGEMPDGQSES